MMRSSPPASPHRQCLVVALTSMCFFWSCGGDARRTDGPTKKLPLYDRTGWLQAEDHAAKRAFYAKKNLCAGYEAPEPEPEEPQFVC